MTPKQFVEELSNLRFRNVFNPYCDVCSVHDAGMSPRIRRDNLQRYVATAIEIGVDTIWMGRDLGYRGGRRTGLPLTDEGHLIEFAQRYPGSQPAKATRTEIVLERTASEVWSKILALINPPFLWNVFPYHPHENEVPLSNRRYTAKELARVDHLNGKLLDMLKIRKILAIGRDAQVYASKLGVDVIPIRHPSYGGLKEFRSKLAKIYPETEREIGRNMKMDLGSSDGKKILVT